VSTELFDRVARPLTPVEGGHRSVGKAFKGTRSTVGRSIEDSDSPLRLSLIQLYSRGTRGEEGDTVSEDTSSQPSLLSRRVTRGGGGSKEKS